MKARRLFLVLDWLCESRLRYFGIVVLPVVLVYGYAIARCVHQ